MVDNKVLDLFANAQGAGTRADILQAVQEFGTLARSVFAYIGLGQPGWRTRCYWRMLGGKEENEHRRITPPELVRHPAGED